MKKHFMHSPGLLIGRVMKFLVTGSTGLIGHQVCKDLTKVGEEVISGYHNSAPVYGSPLPLVLTDHDKLKDSILKIKPDVIIHLGAMTNVDLCEKEKDLAMKINAEATEVLAKLAAKQHAFFIYVSTDYVFDGEKGMRQESDPTNPIDFYGKSKLEGEKAVMNLASSSCIVRTSTPYGVHPIKKSFPLWVIQNLREKKEINIVTDQFTSPTYVPNLSLMLIEIAKRQIVGLIHFAGATRISRYEMAELVAEKLQLDKKLLKPINMKEIKWIAKRPNDSSLNISKAISILNEKPISVNEGLKNLVLDLNTLNQNNKKTKNNWVKM
jgi:dTDP-4-dehydrorhamnose reductase